MLSEGTLLGRYRIDALAAVGGMGAVYRGTDTLLERTVALKVLPSDRASDQGMADRFACESLQAAGLSHPHVLPVYDAGEAEGVAYVAMQWVDGMTLEELVAEDGPLDLDRAVGFTDAIAAALDHAHDNDLVHRDVKPGNVMVDRDGNAYLMDFGLSVRTDRSSALTRTGEFMATVDYAAPEQIEAAEVDHRADVYALAGMAFRLLTGHVPYERETPVARLYAHLNDDPPVASDLRPEVPVAMSDVIRRGLSKRPDGRPATAGAFAAELRAASGAEPLVAPSLGVSIAAAAPAADVPHTAQMEAIGTGSSTPRRGRRILVGAAAIVLAAFGGMSLAGVTGGGGEAGEVPAADAGSRERQERGAETTATGEGEGEVATTATTQADRAAADKAAKRKKQRKDGDRDRSRDEQGGADGLGLPSDDGASAGDGGSSSSAAAPGAPPSGSPAPSGGGSGTPAPTPTQPSTTEPKTTPAEEPPAKPKPEPEPTEPEPEPKPTETQPSEPPPTQTQPTQTQPPTTTQPPSGG